MIRQMIVAAVLFTVAASTVTAGTTYTWVGQGGNARWDNDSNWSPSTGHPGKSASTDDIAIIPSHQGNQPTLNSTNYITIKSLTLSDGAFTDPILTLDEDSSQAPTLIVTDRNGVNIDANCEVKLEKGAHLRILGGTGDDVNRTNKVTLNGRIIFESTAENFRPTLSFGPSTNGSNYYKTTVIDGTGMIVGKAEGYIFPTTAYTPEKNVVVLNPGCQIRGNVTIGLSLVNHGVVNTDDPDASDGGDKISLRCVPMTGSGDWIVGGGASGAPNILEVLVAVSGTGDLTIKTYGKLLVKRHMSIQGAFTMEPNATLEVDGGILFDVKQWPLVCAYSE